MTVQRHGAYRSPHASRQLSLLVFALLILAASAHFANVLPSAAATVVTLPGRFEVEDYSSAGQGVGYYDTTAGNAGGKYRTDDVDIQSTSDSSGTYNIGYSAAGEWLSYDVNVSSSGSYVFNVRAATPYSGKSVHIEVDGVNVTGSMAVQNTGGWQNWTNVASAPVTIAGGSHTIRLVIDTGGINLNYVSLATASTNAFSLPGRFEVEDYSSAGQGVGYYDTTAGNAGGKYRTDDVDIQSTTDSSGTYNVGYSAAGEWLSYDVNVSSSGSYVFNVRAATPYSGKSVHIEVDGVNVTGSMAVQNTGGWQNWTNVASAPVTIAGGSHTVRLVIDTGSINLNYVTVDAATAATAPTVITAAVVHGWGPVVDGDEFSYTGAPDSTKWSLYNSAGHAGNGLRRPEQWNVANGVATVTGTSDGTTGGMSAKFARRMYGRWEVRAKTNERDAKYHPVLLLWRSSNENQRCDEMDFAEGSSKSTGDVRFFLHYGCEPKQTYALKTIDWTQWHTFAIDWNKDRVIGYIDGVEWFRDADPHHVPDQVMYLAAQLDWFPNGTATKTSTMSIDWARVYNP